MFHTPLSAQQLYDECPLGALVRFSDGAVEPSQRHRRKHAAWRSSNGTGRLVRKAPPKQALPASFTLHVGNFGTDDVTVVKAYRVFAVTSPLSFAIVDKPRPGQVALLNDDLGMPSLIHLADTEADARSWLTAHPRDNVRLVPAEALVPRTFTYLQDPGVPRGELGDAGSRVAILALEREHAERELRLDFNPVVLHPPHVLVLEGRQRVARELDFLD